jgi:hypothetical protein
MIKVKKISIFQFIKHMLTAKHKYLGFTWGEDVEVFEVNFPFFGAKRRDKTILHEIGHLEINEKGLNADAHINYDDVTKHGLCQKRWHYILMRKWEYTNDPFKLLV